MEQALEKIGFLLSITSIFMRHGKQFPMQSCEDPALSLVPRYAAWKILTLLKPLQSFYKITHEHIKPHLCWLLLHLWQQTGANPVPVPKTLPPGPEEELMLQSTIGRCPVTMPPPPLPPQGPTGAGRESSRLWSEGKQSSRLWEVKGVSVISFQSLSNLFLYHLQWINSAII